MPLFPAVPDGRSSEGPGVLLDEDECLLGIAYAALFPLLDQLNAHPFDRDIYASLRNYLDGLASQAADAFDRVASRGETALAQRAAVIEGAAFALSREDLL